MIRGQVGNPWPSHFTSTLQNDRAHKISQAFIVK